MLHGLHARHDSRNGGPKRRPRRRSRFNGPRLIKLPPASTGLFTCSRGPTHQRPWTQNYRAFSSCRRASLSAIGHHWTPLAPESIFLQQLIGTQHCNHGTRFGNDFQRACETIKTCSTPQPHSQINIVFPNPISTRTDSYPRSRNPRSEHRVCSYRRTYPRLDGSRCHGTNGTHRHLHPLSTSIAPDVALDAPESWHLLGQSTNSVG